MKIPGMKIAAVVLLVVICFKLWSKPKLEQTDAWGTDVWAERQVPAEIKHPVPVPQPLLVLMESPEFKSAGVEAQERSLAAWATRTHLYLMEQPGYNREDAVKNIQERLDKAATILKIQAPTHEHVDLAATARVGLVWVVLIVGVFGTVGLYRVYREKKKKA